MLPPVCAPVASGICAEGKVVCKAMLRGASAHAADVCYHANTREHCSDSDMSS